MDQHSPTIHQLFVFKILNNCGVLIEFLLPMIWNLSITTFYHFNNALSRMKLALLMHLKVFRIHQYRWIFIQSTETIVWVNIHTLDIERIDFSSFPTQNRQNLNWTKTYQAHGNMFNSIEFYSCFKISFRNSFRFYLQIQMFRPSQYFSKTFRSYILKKKNVII